MVCPIKSASIVDKDGYSRSSLRKILVQIGIQQVEVHATGEEFIATLKMNKPCELLLLSLELDEMDGFSILNLLKTYDQYAEVPVIVLAQNLEKRDLVQAANLGAIDYLPKPFNIKIAQEKVAKAVESLNKSKPIQKYLSAITHYIKIKRLDKARQVVDAFLEKFPNNIRGRFYRGFLELKEKKAKQSIATLQEIIKDNPAFIKAYKLLVKIYEAKGDKASVNKYREMEFEHNTNDITGIMQLVEDFIKDNDLERAIKWLNVVISVDVNNVTALNLLGKLHAMQEDYDNAGEVFKRCYKIEKTNDSCLFLADEAIRSNEVTVAAEYNICIGEIINHPDLMLRNADMALAEKRFSLAESLYGKLTSANPGNTRALIGLAKTNYFTNNLSDVKGYIDKVLNIDPNSTDANLLLIDVFFREEGTDISDEIENLVENVLGDYRNLGVGKDMARRFLDKSMPDRSYKIYQRLVSNFSEDIDLLLKTGRLAIFLGSMVRANEYFSVAKNIDPEDMGVKLLELEMKAGQNPSLEIYNELTTLDTKENTDSNVAMVIAKVLYSMNKIKQAKDYVEKSLKLDETNFYSLQLMDKLDEGIKRAS